MLGVSADLLEHQLSGRKQQNLMLTVDVIVAAALQAQSSLPTGTPAAVMCMPYPGRVCC